MASQFFIEFDIPEDPKLHPKVRVLDQDQDETTGWIKMPKSLRDQPKQVILAAAYLRSWRVKEMLDAAQQVAYAVWLEDEHLDVHAFIPQVQALVERAKLEKRTAPATRSGPGRGPRL